MKKLWRFLFSRYFISAAVIFLELAGIAYLILCAYEYSIYAFLLMLIFDAAAVIGVINREANPEYKLSWLAVVLLVPIFGAVLYFIFYSTHLSRKSARLMRRIEAGLLMDDGASDGEERRDVAFSELWRTDPSAAGKAYAILNDDATAALYRATKSQVFRSGEEMYRAMLSDLEGAEKFIFLEYFIISEGEMWGGIYEILKKKAALGVEVRVMYDDVGSMSCVAQNFVQKLSADGIICRRFGAVTPRISTSHNNRDHRKIMIIDGRVAYTGGINLSDEYVNRRCRFGYWKDGGVRIFGDAVRGFLKLFLGLWDFDRGEAGEYRQYLSKTEPEVEGDGYYIPFGSGPAPIYPHPVGKNALLNLINQAEEYLYITTPYLVIDYDLRESISNAARRGVDVRIITPYIADKRLVKLTTKSAYLSLISAGVRIYEYTPGFIHEKSLCSDDKYALVGTINLDYRSLAHHYENAVWMYGTPSVMDIKRGFLDSVSVSEEVTSESAKLGFFERILRSLVRIFDPLM